MNRTAYLIIFINAEGVIADALITSEYPVAQLHGPPPLATKQALLHQEYGADFEQAVINLLDYAAVNLPWVFQHAKLRKEATNLMRLADSKVMPCHGYPAMAWRNVRKVLQGAEVNADGQIGAGDLVQIVAGPWLGRSGSVVSVGEGTVVVWLGHARCFEPDHLKVISRGEPGAPLVEAAVGVPTATGSVARCKHGGYACECCGTTYVRDSAHTTDGGVGVVGKIK